MRQILGRDIEIAGRKTGHCSVLEKSENRRKREVIPGIGVGRSNVCGHKPVVIRILQRIDSKIGVAVSGFILKT